MVLAPGTKRGEPQVPVEARLIGRIDAGGSFYVLWLVAERIGGPGCAVPRSLELDLVALVGHDSEQAVSVSYAKWFEYAYRPLPEEGSPEQSNQQERRAGVKHPAEAPAGQGPAHRLEPPLNGRCRGRRNDGLA